MFANSWLGTVGVKDRRQVGMSCTRKCHPVSPSVCSANVVHEARKILGEHIYCSTPGRVAADPGPEQSKHTISQRPVSSHVHLLLVL